MLSTCLVAAMLIGADGAAPTPIPVERSGLRITGLAPEPGSTGTLGFVLETDWLEGTVVLRCPETLSSSMGLHFIDHRRDDMPPLSPVSEPVQWRADQGRGVLTYRLTTPEGVSFEGTAEAGLDGAWITLRVHNGTGGTLGHVSCQMCLDLSNAGGFGQKESLADIFTWVDGERFLLDSATPTASEKGRTPWLLMPTKGLRPVYTGPMDYEDSWWVADQTADEPLLARSSSGGAGIAGIAWHDPAAMLMSNTAIPCLHAGPSTPLELAPGESRVWRGKVYLNHYTPDQLKRQFRIDQAEAFVRHDLVVSRPDAKAQPAAVKSLRVAAVRVAWNHGAEPPQAIIERGFGLAKEAVAWGAELVVFPENFLHADDPRDQMIPDGALVKRAEAFAREHGVYLCAGMIESWKFDWRETYDTYLSAIVVGPGGYLSKHRKVDVTLLPYNRAWAPGVPRTDMGTWAGDDFAMHRAGTLERMGVMICRDSNSSWAWTRVLTQNPELIVSPNLRDSVVKYGADFGAMAAKAGVPIVVACGDPQSESFIVNRRGEVVAFINDQEGVVTAEVDLAPRDPALVSFDVIHNSFVVPPKH